MNTNHATGYKPAQRRLECAAIALFAGLAAWSLWRLWHASGLHFFPITLLAVASAWLMVDLLSGLLHLALDSWGSVHTPIVGQAFIRPFREHHINPHEMTQHDFIELNGSSSFACLPLLCLGAGMPLTSLAWISLQALLLFIALGALITNECHKWAHADATNTPPLIRWAQHHRVVLSPEHHRLHHTAPFNSYFCMANGWLNVPLNACLRAWK